MLYVFQEFKIMLRFISLSCSLKTEPTCTNNAPEDGNSTAKRKDVRFYAARFGAAPDSFAECLKLERLIKT